MKFQSWKDPWWTFDIESQTVDLKIGPWGLSLLSEHTQNVVSVHPYITSIVTRCRGWRWIQGWDGYGVVGVGWVGGGCLHVLDVKSVYSQTTSHLSFMIGQAHWLHRPLSHKAPRTVSSYRHVPKNISQSLNLASPVAQIWYHILRQWRSEVDQSLLYMRSPKWFWKHGYYWFCTDPLCQQKKPSNKHNFILTDCDHALGFVIIL